MIKNIRIADILEETADLLDILDKNPFRVRSYKTAAQTIRGMDKPLVKIFDEKGVDGLKELPIYVAVS